MAFIHKFKQGDKYFVLDVNTGAVHVVDELVYDILDDDNIFFVSAIILLFLIERIIEFFIMIHIHN